MASPNCRRRKSKSPKCIHVRWDRNLVRILRQRTRSWNAAPRPSRNISLEKCPFRLRKRLCGSYVAPKYNRIYLRSILYSGILCSMGIVERAAEVIARAESALKELLAEAAQGGDYSAVAVVTTWARTVHELVGTTATRRPLEDIHKAHRGGRRSSRKIGSRPTTITVPRKSAHYPVFVRAGDELVMLAWSKRDQKEYRHKASHEVLLSLARAMMEQGSGGRLFSTDELLPIRTVTDGREVPNYKAYAVISFMKHSGLIEQHGRRGYSIPRINEFEGAVENLWQQLPTR